MYDTGICFVISTFVLQNGYVIVLVVIFFLKQNRAKVIKVQVKIFQIYHIFSGRAKSDTHVKVK